MTTPDHGPVRRGFSFLLGMIAFAALAVALVLGPYFIEFHTPFYPGPPPEDGKAALIDIIGQVRAAKPAGRPTWLTGPAPDNGCALPANVIAPQDWAVLDLIEHDGEYAQLYAVCTVRQATLVRARFRWPDGEIEFTVTDMEATHGR